MFVGIEYVEIPFHFPMIKEYLYLECAYDLKKNITINEMFKSNSMQIYPCHQYIIVGVS